jgi:hypothetical protein
MVDSKMADIEGRDREDYLGAINLVSTELEQMFIEHNIVYYDI